ncbi:SRPBCC family protein [Phreatobacter stygius]|uniref:SRPBCC domain-containing protein n=1 Tax=Phreatobacter stygius TaxID=1940610 RepID=A0A4D7B0W5_9HYPH|nr:SRPBCC domain-containing protein [Phreatobacter stygius]QCI67319.1 SRPBCC domain-containing protein [Phreatobacter stygius]
MPVKKDASGRRSVEAEVEVPGTPDQVWAAIATGPGISSWFVPSEVEERTGGTAVSHFGPGNSMDSVGSITEWAPPRRFVVETTEGPSPVATEWTVEARGGGTCVVRVVHSWFASNDDWDSQFEGHTYGWLSFFRVLKLYLAHFAGRHGTSFQVMGIAPEPKSEAWMALTGPLGLAGATAGDQVATPADGPPLAGAVAWAGQPEAPEELLVQLDRPAPGLAHLVPHAMGGKVYLTIRFYLYGEGAGDAARQAETAWTAWIGARFASPTEEVS